MQQSQQHIQELTQYSLSVIEWFRNFPLDPRVKKATQADELSDGLFLTAVLHKVDPHFFKALKQSQVREANTPAENLAHLDQALITYYAEVFGVDIVALTTRRGDQQSFSIQGVMKGNIVDLMRLIELVLCALIKSEAAPPFIEIIESFGDDIQFDLYYG
ncbi:hypothetical protein FGO68_gene7698 [Halteria grandinella]|uniref:HOOK N-terminal domain-containing protein n=1 Tax=Halteria grandinella TaxID=5974 RepID=A0A8J8NY92_HALGN|nr:hypothetical protein FGO68_gene7698 [Halteria grandinella]